MIINYQQLNTIYPILKIKCKLVKYSVVLKKVWWRWVDKYKSTNNITRKKRDYTSYKITNSHISFIKQQLKDDKTITMDELLSKLTTKYQDLSLSRIHLGRVVRDINITLKQTRLRHVPKTRYKKPIVIKNQIKEFYSNVKQYSQ